MSPRSLARLRVRSSLAVAGRQIRETAFGPGFYVVLAVALLVSHALVTAFAASIDAGGLDPERSALYRLLYNASVAAFGQTFFESLFAEGPFVPAYTLSYGMVALSLATSSVARLALERRVGAMELVSYGPADATSSFLGSLARDLVFSLGSALLLVCLLLTLAARLNLALGPRLWLSVAAMVGLGLGLSSLGILCAAATTRVGSATGLFAGLLLLFAALLVSRYAALSGYLRNLSASLSGVLQWLSPFSYWDLAMASAGAGRSVPALFAILALPALSATYLVASHLLVRTAGSRP